MSKSLRNFYTSCFFVREVIRPDVMEEVIVSCVIKHLSLVDALQSLVNYQYREDHTEEYDLLCKIMAETFKKINAMERQLQVSLRIFENTFINYACHKWKTWLDFQFKVKKFFIWIVSLTLRQS